MESKESKEDEEVILKKTRDDSIYLNSFVVASKKNDIITTINGKETYDRIFIIRNK